MRENKSITIRAACDSLEMETRFELEKQQEITAIKREYSEEIHLKQKIRKNLKT